MLVAPRPGAPTYSRGDGRLPRRRGARHSKSSLLAARVRHPEAPMPGPPVLFASYSGVLGGAERVLLDCADAPRAPGHGRLPGGTAGRRAARARESRTRRSAQRPLRLGARATPPTSLGLARDLRRLEPGVRRRLGRAGGARRRARAAARGSPSTTTCCDGPRARRRARRDAARRRRRRRLAGDRRASSAADATVLHPGVDLARFTPQPRPRRPAPRARARRARRLEAARAGTRDRRPHAGAAR